MNGLSGDVWGFSEMCGDARRCAEMCGDVRSYAEVCGGVVRGGRKLWMITGDVQSCS